MERMNNISEKMFHIFSEFPNNIEFSGTYEEIVAKYLPEARIVDDLTVDIGDRRYSSYNSKPHVLYDLATNAWNISTPLAREDMMLKSMIANVNTRVVSEYHLMLYRKTKEFLKRGSSEVTIVLNDHNKKTYMRDDMNLYWNIARIMMPGSHIESPDNDGDPYILEFPCDLYCNFPSAQTKAEAFDAMAHTVLSWPLWKRGIYLE